MQFPQLFSSSRRPGLQEMSRDHQQQQQQDQDYHKTAFNNKYCFPRADMCNNKTGGSKSNKKKTSAAPWKLETEITLGDSLVEQDNNMACVVVAPSAAVETTKSRTSSSNTHHHHHHAASGDERKGARGGGVVGKLLMLTLKNRHQQRSRATATAPAESSPSPSCAPRHDSVTSRTCFSSSICTNISSSLPSDRNLDSRLLSTSCILTSPDSSHSGHRHHQEQQSTLSSSDALPAALSFIQQQQQQGECDHPSLLPLPNTIASSTSPTTYQLQKHEYSELGYMQFQYSIDDDDKNTSSSSSSYALQEARAKASLTQKPLLIVYAVVPNGDLDAGLHIFSHPLVVEAAQSLFVTVFCKTKLEQQQQQPKCRTRVSFWHHLHDDDNASSSEQNPNDLVPCIHGDTLTLSSVVSGMIQALQAFHATSTLSSESSSSSLIIPKYLLLLQEETNALPLMRTCLSSSSLSSSSSSLSGNHGQTKTAVFGMDDSHLGEVEFAGCNGVLATLAGHYHDGPEQQQPQQRHEPKQQHVVQVSYDSRILSYCSLVRYALQRRVGQIIYYQTNDERVAATMECDRIRSSATVRKLESSSTSPVQDNNNCTDYSNHSHSSHNKDATTTTRTLSFSCIVPDYDPKRALRKTPIKYVPLTSLQATRANRLVYYGRFDEAMHLLSPQQGLILMQQAMRTSANKDMHEMVDIPIAHAWLCVCEQVHPKFKVTNDMNNNDLSLEDEEDTNEWGGRCFD